MSDDNKSGGIGLTGGVFLVFLGLKLGNVIDWPWWWVTAPLWGPLLIILVIFLVVYSIYLGKKAFKKFSK